jgi:D-alanine-D-alanine ligase-like ATP-grasp enzyme
MKDLELPIPLEILKQACVKWGYQFEIIDTFSGYLAEVNNGSNKFLAATGSFSPYPINPATSQICRDKAFTKMALEKTGIRVPKGEHFFIKQEFIEYRPQGKEYEDAIKYANSTGYPLFLKPNNGSHGVGCSVVYGEVELREKLNELAERNLIVMLEEIVSGHEYRFIVVDGTVQLAYRREMPCIEGNGVSSIKELVEDFNCNRVSDPRAKVEIDSPFFIKTLKDKCLSINSVLRSGKKLRISLNANLRSGGDIAEVIHELPSKVHEWASQVSNALDVRVCGIDLFTKDLEDIEKFVAVEVNDRVSFHSLWFAGYKEEVLSIWGNILRSFFQ